MYVPLFPILITILILAVIAIIFWVAYSYSAAYQNTLAITLPFQNTLCYSNGTHRPITSFTITLAGNMMNRKSPQIINSLLLQEKIRSKILDDYRDTVIVHEADIFTVSVPNENMKRHPIAKVPTLENLTIMLFKRIEGIISDMRQGAQLVSVELFSDNVKVMRSRYKINSYTL
jgi:hypothetical protein